VDEDARATWLKVDAAAAHPLKAAEATPADQPVKGRLSAEREVSSIPRAASATYAHAAEQAAKPAEGEETGNWVYPSEQQFFNAMMRKNHNPRAADMRTIVPIHNAVNEKAWEEVLMWEAGKGGDRCGGVRLSSFVGRPKERSPKAWAKTMFG
jgi:cytochrome c heme-lyase